MAMIIPATATARPANPVISNNTYNHIYKSSDRTTTTTNTQTYTQNNDHIYTIEVCVFFSVIVIIPIIAFLIAESIKHKFLK